ncbi:uncharacterized protein LOC142219722 [Haematobia irritans]|uniref:uncharacterized protein LOC142219722 n=1 Tax=Haematobia irritans TaxID=7368 RepID=UPI003F5019B1
MKQIVIVFALFISASAAFKRPNWYPQNGAEIEADCMAKISVSDSILQNLRRLKIDDNEETRDLILCCLRNTNVYRPGYGPEADRIAVAFQQSLKLNCDIDLIQGCIPKFIHEMPEKYQFFRTIKCIYDEAPQRCLP